MCVRRCALGVRAGARSRPPADRRALALRHWQTTYYYSYGSNTSDYSGPHQFVSAKPASRTTPVTFLAYGDMGLSGAPGAVTTAERIKQYVDKYASGACVCAAARAEGGVRSPRRSLRSTDLILHVGDISYACGDAVVWDSWFELVRPTAEQLPYMISIGASGRARGSRAVARGRGLTRGPPHRTTSTTTRRAAATTRRARLARAGTRRGATTATTAAASAASP